MPFERHFKGFSGGDARQKRRQPAATQVGQAPIGKRVKATRLASLTENSATMTADAELRASPQESSLPESQHSAAVENQSEVSLEDWQHREEKRRKAVVIVKATPEYHVWSAQVEQNVAPMNRESLDQAWQCVSPAGPVG